MGAQKFHEYVNIKEYSYMIKELICMQNISEEKWICMQGLNELVPDSLLSIFDERELELLLCGIGKIDMDDFRKNTMVTSFNILYT